MFALIAGLLLASFPPAVAARRANTTIPITQTVTIDGVEVYSQSSGHELLNTCTSFARTTVNDAARPKITVCGTSTKVQVFLMNRCAGYHTYTQDIGACDTKQPSGTCVTESPATTTWLQTAQSYKIIQCAV
mmetsp:Transcript_110142/g.351328  ORF Transcript_110142/g.351328 Transcript_110142/m.351328 type:complete len:132 (+) Transcript_110142:62-457(+)